MNSLARLSGLAQLARRGAGAPWAGPGAPACLQLASWLSSAAGGTLDASECTERAQALRSSDLLRTVVEPLRSSSSAVPIEHLLDLARQQ